MQEGVSAVQTITTGLQSSMCSSTKPTEREGEMEQEKGETERGDKDLDGLEERPGTGSEPNSTHTGQWEKLHFVYWEH